MTMLRLLKEIYPLRLAPVSSDTDKCVEILRLELPFVVHEYASLSEFNGWVIPMSWEVEKAEIHKDGKLIYDGTRHPLGVTGYSRSFSGELTLQELKEHLYYSAKLPGALVYYYKQFYRNWEQWWGFSVPYDLYKTLEEGVYRVELECIHKEGTLKVCDYFHQGETDDTIVLSAHNCHAGQANDDISGVVAGIEIMKRLMGRKTRYSYRLLIAPEQFGAIFYLAALSGQERNKMKYCIYLEALGHDNRLALQKSFNGDTELDEAGLNYLSQKSGHYYTDDFRKILGNDETVWEAPGYEIPAISVSRAEPVESKEHYLQYHTSQDNDEIISEDMLEESVEAVMGICDILEKNRFISRKFDGLIALSNPKYDLYFDSFDPAVLGEHGDTQKKWFQLVTRLMRYFDGKTSVLDIAQMHGLPSDELYEYLLKFQEKGLVELHYDPVDGK